jgi:hypothetical protein
MVYFFLETKPNPLKGGDGKPRVLASFEKPRKTPRMTQDSRAAENQQARESNYHEFSFFHIECGCAFVGKRRLGDTALYRDF